MRVTYVSLLLVVAMLGTACSDSAPAVEFGEGEIPESAPDDFPFPTSAVIGATLVDSGNGRTEVEFRVPAPVLSVAQSFDVNLVNRGYVVDSSSGDESRWTVQFRRDDLSGEIDIRASGESVSVAVVEFIE